MDKIKENIYDQLKVKFKEFTELVKTNADQMKSANAHETLETLACSIECMNDQIDYAFDMWN
jgi:hypothetical protein